MDDDSSDGKVNILILDNDECLGQFGLLNGIYNNSVRLHLDYHKQPIDHPHRRQVEDLFVSMACDFLELGFARPYLKQFLKLIKTLKEIGKLDYVVMYTSALRNDPANIKYSDWVDLMKKILETYGCNDLKTATEDGIYRCEDLIQVYNLDLSGRSDEIGMEVMSLPSSNVQQQQGGFTYKNVGFVLQKLGVSIDDVNSIVFIDDNTQNVRCDYECSPNKLKLISVEPYFYLPKLSKLLNVFEEKYYNKFEKLGVNMTRRLIIDEYEYDLPRAMRYEVDSRNPLDDNALKNKADLLKFF